MENKLSIPLLSASLAQATGKSKRICEDFIKEFFKIAAETLENGEIVKIKGFGTFKITYVEERKGVNIHTGNKHIIAPHKKVVFTPTKELASAVNAPFEDFVSVEIDDEIPDFYFDDEILTSGVESSFKEPNQSSKEEEIDVPPTEETEEEEIRPEEKNGPAEEDKDKKDEIESGEEPKIETPEEGDENEVSEGIIEAGSDEEAEDDEITYEAYTETEEEPASETPDMTSSEIEDASESEEIPEERPQPMEMLPVQYKPVESKKFRYGFLFGALTSLLVCVIIFMLGCFFDWWPLNFGDGRKIAVVEETRQHIPVETVSEGEETPVEEPASPEPEIPPVYDTVSTTRYLTTIAREHYGNYNFWPYIYLENQSILGHPDRITPGTKVVVPPLSKYGVDPKNKEDIAEAKKKALEIYSKFK